MSHRIARKETEQAAGITYRPVDVVSLKSCSRDEFVERYLRPGIPCIIEDLVSDWPAYRKWSKAYFEEDEGQSRMYYNIQEKEGSGLKWSENLLETNLADFIARVEKGEQIKHFGLGHPLYDFVNSHPTLLGDVRLESFNQVLPDARFVGLSRLDSRFWPWVPPYPPMLYIAGAESLSPGHYDPDHSETFHWCVWGRKSVKLFPFDSRFNGSICRLKASDLSKPFDPVEAGEYSELNGCKAWFTEVKPGQVLYIPSKMWHFFKNEEVSMSFVVRARSFDTVEGYCNFARDVQSPLRMIPFHAQLWRMVGRSRRTVMGNVLATFERPVVGCTWAILKLLQSWMAVRRGLQRAWKSASRPVR